MTTPGKNYPGQKGFPTPNDTPLDEGYLLFKFPNSNDWAGVLLAAAGTLGYDYNWFDWGEMTTEEAADAWEKIVTQAPHNVIESETPAPYWDDAEDADDQAPPDEQPWYGHVEGLTFVEEIEIWAITGFIAYSGQFGAAIAFRTFAPKFVLAWKKGGVLAAVEVFINGVSNGLLEVEDGDGIVTQTYIGDQEEDEQEILVVYRDAAALRRANVRSTQTTRRVGRRSTKHTL